MQAECTVIELTCVDKSERSIGFVHTIPGIMISAGALQANDVINATAAAPKQQLSRRYILQAAVTTSQMQYLRNSRENQPRRRSAQKRLFQRRRKNTYINELTCKISDDFFVFFRAVKHSKKILADNQLFTGLRDGCPGLSLGIPHPPYGAFPKSCLHQSAICRRMGGTEADVLEQIRHEVSVSTHPQRLRYDSKMPLFVGQDVAERCRNLEFSKTSISASQQTELQASFQKNHQNSYFEIC